MKMSEFLTKRAWRKYTTMNELWKYAKEDFKLQPFKNKQEFFDLLGKCLRKWARDGKMPNGMVFYTELVFRTSQGSVRMSKGNVGLIKVTDYDVTKS